MPLMLGNICLFYDGTIHIASDTLSSTTVQALNIILQVILLIFYGYMIILLMRRGYYLIDTCTFTSGSAIHE